MKILMILLFLVSCNNAVKKPNVVVIKAKYCITACTFAMMKTLHNKGESWGTGSSSLNGFSQEKTIDRIEQYCDKFFKDEKCCERVGQDFTGIDFSFDYRYGACK